MTKKLIAIKKIRQISQSTGAVAIPIEYMRKHNLVAAKSRLEMYELDDKYLLLIPHKEI